MSLELIAEQAGERERFAPFYIILFFAAAVFGVLFLFFPENEVLDKIAMEGHANPLTLSYIENLMRTQPKNKNLRLVLIEQQIKLGKFKQANESIHAMLKKHHNDYTYWRLMWLQYQLLRQRVYANEPGSIQRYYGQRKLVAFIHKLAKMPLTLREYALLSRDAMFHRQNKLARSIYDHIFKMAFKSKDVLSLEMAAKVALSVSDYGGAADLYFMAQKSTKLYSQQRRFFVAGLRCLQSGNLLSDAVKAVRVNGEFVKEDVETLQFIAQLLLAAEQPQLAQIYMLRALRLH